MAQPKLCVRCKQFIGDRAEQQDACGVSSAKCFDQKGLLALLCDGMGGMSRGSEFSALAIKTMLERFESEPPQADPCAELLALYQAAQQAVLHAQLEENDGGATLVAVLVRDGRCAFLSAGDSRLYLLRGGGALVLNREQSLGVTLDERAAMGYLPPEEARLNTRRSSLTNYLGATPAQPPDRNLDPFALRPGDRLALMSDGVFGTLGEGELCALLSGEPQAAARSVVQAVQAKQRAHQDNASILIIGCL